MFLAVGFIAGHCVQAHGMNAFENAFFNVGTIEEVKEKAKEV